MYTEPPLGASATLTPSRGRGSSPGGGALTTSSATGEAIERLLADLDAAQAPLPALLQNAGRAPLEGRPFVTLTYAQSIDGSIAFERGRPCLLSGPESLRMTHALRAAHDAILVGIGTVLADDPQLTVRLADGPSPRPVVVDSRLRTPTTARLLAAHRCNGAHTPWIATTCCDEAGRRRLEAAGARVVQVGAWGLQGWVDLEELLRHLAEQGVRRLMVEGGARVITSFLRARLVDYAVITVAPRLVGGLAALGAMEPAAAPRFGTLSSARLGDDLVLSGDLRWTPEG